MSVYGKYTVLILAFGILCLIATSSLAQLSYQKLTVDFIDSLKKNNSDTIIEIKINYDNLHSINYPSTYIYFKNNPGFFYKFCGNRFNNKSKSKTECNNDWQIFFDFISDHWATIKSEIMLPDSTVLPDGTTIISSSSRYDIVEIIVHLNEKTEKIVL